MNDYIRGGIDLPMPEPLPDIDVDFDEDLEGDDLGPDESVEVFDIDEAMKVDVDADEI